MNVLIKTRLQKLERQLDGDTNKEFEISPEQRLAVGKALYAALDIPDFNTCIQAVHTALNLIPCRRTRPYTAAEQAALLDVYNRLALEGGLPNAEKKICHNAVRKI